MCLFVVVSMLPGLTSSTWAQEPDASPGPVAPSPFLTRPVAQDVIVLPTTASLDRFGSYFRLTHRFGRDLRGSFLDLAKSAFGLDDGAIIGFEYRFAPAANYRSARTDSLLYRTIQIFARHDTIRQTGRMPVAVSLLESVEGQTIYGAVLAGARSGRIPNVWRSLATISRRSWFGIALPSALRDTRGHDHDVPGAAMRITRWKKSGLPMPVLAPAAAAPNGVPRGEIIPRTGFTPGTSVGRGYREAHRRPSFQLTFSNSWHHQPQIARGGQRAMSISVQSRPKVSSSPGLRRCPAASEER